MQDGLQVVKILVANPKVRKNSRGSEPTSYLVLLTRRRTFRIENERGLSTRRTATARLSERKRERPNSAFIFKRHSHTGNTVQKGAF